MKQIVRFGLVAAVVFAAGCKQKPQSEAKIPITPTQAPADSIHQGMVAEQPSSPFQAQLDSGNIAYRAKDYKKAKEHYTNATQIDSTKGAAWFGVYMAEDKLGNKAAADLAIKKAQSLNPQFDAKNPHAGAAMPATQP